MSIPLHTFPLSTPDSCYPEFGSSDPYRIPKIQFCVVQFFCPRCRKSLQMLGSQNTNRVEVHGCRGQFLFPLCINFL